MYKLVVNEKAQEDFESMYFYYKLFVSDKVATDFLNDYRSALKRVENNPEMYPNYEDVCRKYIFKKFKHTLYFTLSNKSIKIIAVLHQSRDAYNIVNKR